MPEKDFKSLTQSDRAKASDYEPGYDWIPGRFGPPPGISRERKRQLDRMTDRDYMAAVLRMGQEEKESLMISEAERLRTYRSLWPNPPCVSYKELAREGFYYTGQSDRVQCAFCGGFLGNWEAGDIPRESHKQFFSYCKMAKRSPCANIPLSDGKGLPDDVSLNILSTRKNSVNDFAQNPSLSDLGISSNKPVHPRYRVYSTRLGTYRNYSSCHPMPPEILSEAGFFYEGPGDKVRCFWCDGALELWSEGDDTWSEHAKWYPGCEFVQQVKGRQFIKDSRSQMTAEDVATADGLQYNSSGIEFLNESTPSLDSVSNISNYDTYQVCEQLGFDAEQLEKAFSYTDGEDYSDVQGLLDVLLAIREDNQERIDQSVKAEVTKSRQHTKVIGEATSIHFQESSAEARYFLDIDRLMKEMPEDIGEQDAKLFIAAMTCQLCGKGEIGAVILPCGHLALCQKCSLGTLPDTCPVCHTPVRAACRTFLS